MTDLERARQTINSVDKEMAELFEKRMEAVKLNFRILGGLGSISSPQMYST